MDSGTTQTVDLDSIRVEIKRAVEHGAGVMANRRLLTELVFLCLISQENLLLIGPPGTGKSAAARIAANFVGGQYFEYLVGRFTEPSEIFGPLDLVALQNGEVRPDVSGMLPEAELAFLDEIFLGSTAILNTLLGILNERRYRRGHVDLKCPLKCCFAASNHFPDDPMLRAFADRFLITIFVDPVGDHALESLLDTGWRYGVQEVEEPPRLTMQDIAQLTEAAKCVDMTVIRGSYAHAVRKLRTRGIEFSDRRIVKGQTLIASTAAVAGRAQAGPEDLWPIIYMAQDRAAQDEARDILQEELGRSESPVFSEAAQNANIGAAARADELRSYGVKLLEMKPTLQSGEAWEVWLVKAEALLTQIDAGFAHDTRPEGLTAIRASLEAQAGTAVPENGTQQ